ncbi:acyltransferase domain-containing protein [Streptomyces sp. M19]
MDTSQLTADYWFRNLRETVRFGDTVRGLMERGFTTFVEISPHPVLTVAVEQTAESARAAPPSSARCAATTAAPTGS